MYTFPVSTLRPGMVLYEDLYTPENILLLKANTLLTEDKIILLKDHHIENVTLAEPLEINISHYEYLHNSEHFKNFTAIYDESVSSFAKLLHVFETGLDINTDKYLALRDDILHAVRNEDQLLDYLYNLMANENQLESLGISYNSGVRLFSLWGDDGSGRKFFIKHYCKNNDKAALSINCNKLFSYDFSFVEKAL